MTPERSTGDPRTLVIDTDRSYESVRAFSRDVRHVDLAL